MPCEFSWRPNFSTGLQETLWLKELLEGCPAMTEGVWPCQNARLATDTFETPCQGKGIHEFKDYIGIRKPEFIFLLLHQEHVGFVGIHVGCIYLTKKFVFALGQVLHCLFIWTKDVNSITKFTQYRGLLPSRESTTFCWLRVLYQLVRVDVVQCEKSVCFLTLKIRHDNEHQADLQPTEVFFS